MSKKHSDVEVETVEVGEYSVNLASVGEGPNVLMLHGEEGRPSWEDWEGFIPLAESRRLLMPDLVGYGRSSRPRELPGYKAQAQMLRELLDVIKVDKATLVGYSWGGQVAMEFAIEWPARVENLILVASTYDKSQLPKLSGIGRPTLIVWGEDDMITQLKAGYLLRDAIGTSRLEVLPPVAKDPRYDYTIAHQLLRSRKEELLKKFRSFLASPSTAQPPELEKELRGMALKGQGEGKA
jgi:pimeloyl-ACP methyl ester carboxylesterase